jgi:hypothetical protein
VVVIFDAVSTSADEAVAAAKAANLRRLRSLALPGMAERARKSTTPNLPLSSTDSSPFLGEGSLGTELTPAAAVGLVGKE